VKTCFTLTIVAKDTVAFNGKAQSCRIDGLTGSRGFEANHEPFLTVLNSPSVVEYVTESGKTTKLRVASGLASFARNVCSLVVEVDPLETGRSSVR